MPGMPWVKIYTEILDDVKILRLTDAQKWRFIQLILFAAECDAEGALVTGESPVTHEDVTIRLRCDTETWAEDYKKLLALGLIYLDDDVIVVTNFANKQGPTQEEKRKQWRERQRKRRERVKKESPVSHGGVTPLEEEEESEEEKEKLNGASADIEPPEPVKKVSKKKARDPLLDHPAIIAYKDEARLHVPITWREQVCETVDDAEMWKDLVHSWIGKGWNKQNIEGMLQAYVNGGIDKQKEEPAGFSAIRSYRKKAGLDNG